MDTNIAPASLASGRAVPIRAECGCGVHDAPPGCAWNHCHEEYVWTPVCFTTAPHHGLVWSYLIITIMAKPVFSRTPSMVGMVLIFPVRKILMRVQYGGIRKMLF